jgi:O-antigen ligase
MVVVSGPLLRYRDRAASRLRLGPRQMVILLLAAPLVLLGASGWTQHIAFSTPSPVKYALTVAGPLVLVAVALAPQPFLVLAAMVIVAAPAATLKITFSGVSFDALAVACLVAAVPLFLGFTRPVGRSMLGRATPFAVVLAAPGLALGTGVQPTVLVAVMAIAVIFICARAVQLPGGVPVVLGAGLASLVLQAGIAVWEYVTGSVLNAYYGAAAQSTDYFFGYQTKSRPTGTFFDPISLATCLAVAVPVGVAAIYLLLRHRKWIMAVVVAAAVGTIGLALTLSLSRMATIGALASLIIVVALVPRRSRLRITQIVGTIVVALLVGALTVGGPSLIQRALSVSDPTAAGVVTADGDRDREAYWHVAIQAGMHHPVAGVGVGNLNAVLLADAPDSGVFTHAHSVYLQIFSESGVLGLLALAVLGAGLTMDLRRAYGQAPVLVAGLAGAVVALAVAGLTDIVILRYEAVAASIAPVFGLIAGLAARGAGD